MRLIDADALTIKLNKIPEYDFYEQTGNPFNYAKFLDVFTAVENAPTIEQRSNGHWIEHNPHVHGLGSKYECSECGEEVDSEPYNFCPYCGAKMLTEEQI